MKQVSNMIWGIILIIIGIIFGLNALGLTSINVFFDGWWTLFIIIPSFVGLFKNQDKTGNIIALIIGLIFLLACQDLIDFSIVWKLIFPIIIVLIGISFLFKDLLHGEVNKISKKFKRTEDNSYCATFGSQVINFDNEIFKGCNIDAVFGSVKCDLRKAKLKDDAVINVSAIFGGVDIILPENVKVKISSTPIFGGVDNKFTNSKEKNVKTIYIKASCVFGGVELK